MGEEIGERREERGEKREERRDRREEREEKRRERREERERSSHLERTRFLPLTLTIALSGSYLSVFCHSSQS